MNDNPAKMGSVELQSARESTVFRQFSLAGCRKIFWLLAHAGANRKLQLDKILRHGGNAAILLNLTPVLLPHRNKGFIGQGETGAAGGRRVEVVVIVVNQLLHLAGASPKMG